MWPTVWEKSGSGFQSHQSSNMVASSLPHRVPGIKTGAWERCQFLLACEFGGAGFRHFPRSQVTLTFWEEEDVEKSSMWFWGWGEKGEGDTAEDRIVPGLEIEEGIGDLRKQKGAKCAEEQKKQSDQSRKGDAARWRRGQICGSELKCVYVTNKMASVMWQRSFLSMWTSTLFFSCMWFLHNALWNALFVYFFETRTDVPHTTVFTPFLQLKEYHGKVLWKQSFFTERSDND